jgi:phosphoribosylanthranilate isomerase
MRATQNRRIKICCISSLEEAALAMRHGAAALGLVSAMPSEPGVIPEELIATIAAQVPPGVASFLLTSLQSAAASVPRRQRRCGTNTVQICDRLATHAYSVLRRELPGIGLVQVIHVTGPEAVAEASEVAPLVDALLLDCGNQTLPLKELGGTGRIHDWTLSRAIREAVEVPSYLAGGLRPENVAAAIQQVGPFGLDICTGLRTDGRLDEVNLARFMAVIQRAAGI